MPLARSHLQQHPVYVVPAWHGLPIIHGFGTADVPLERYCALERWSMPVTRQIHSNVIHVIERLRPMVPLIGDAFVTQIPQVVCAVRTADCVPLLLIDPVTQVVGAIHAGWRGLANGIIPRTIETIASRFRVAPSRLQVAIGPAIGRTDYEIDAAVRDALRKTDLCVDECFTASPACRQAGDAGHWYLDLHGLAERQLLSCDIQSSHIIRAELSTYTRPGEFHSYRRRPSRSSRQISFIGLFSPRRR